MTIEHGRRVNPWAVMAVISMGLFMTLLDLTIVNIAIPSVIDSLKASLDQVLWVLNAYSLVYAVLLITSGRLGDVFGPRNLFAAGIVVFTVASAASGLAHDPGQLIAARAAQGLGAALIAPQGLPLMTSLWPPERRGGVFAVFGILAGLAVVAGPTLGGFIVTHFGWQWIFYVNLPVGAITLVAAFVAVPDLRPGRQHRLDLLGVLLATTGLLGIVFGLIEGQRYDWGTVWAFITIPEIIGGGVLLLALFMLSQMLRQDREPLLPFAVFKDRNYTMMTGVLAAMGFAILGLYLPMTIFFQSVMGLSAVDAGLTMAAQPLAMMFVSPITNGLASRFGGKYVLIPGLILFASGAAYIDWAAHADSARWSFLPGLIASGVGLAGTWGPLYAIATRDLKPHLAGVASGVLNTIQELGAVIASATAGALLLNRLAVALHDQAINYSTQLPEQFRGGFVDGFGAAARGGLEVGAGQTGASVQLPPGVPAAVVVQLQQLAHDVFTHAFVIAMRPTLLVPIVIVLLAAIACLGVRNRPATAHPATETPAEASSAA
ncbi:MAG TPA: DHA2 family efflux MFS transporter permease subunit [Candidatus Dormibacteraeota bacterium]|nr:DHA2 family efflux MFS transporter permease subunit [Candidatus Dormibacteraeota bacterium]